jgi:uncharacterized protein YbjT (DUF2867 family)
MASQKIIAVVGATGAQGGGLVRAIQRDGTFQARAITRDVGSEKARALRDVGAEVVAGDVDDEASLAKAFAGAHGIYGVTFFWAHFSPEKERQQAANIARAAKTAAPSHVIWSTLEDTRKFVPLDDDRMPTLQEKYKVPHFDAKGEANHFFTDLGLPVTFLHASFYWENFVYFGSGPKPGPDGVLALTLPIGREPMAGVAAEDIGKCALGIFKAGAPYIGRNVGIAGEHLTGGEMAAAMTKALGREVRYNEVSPATYRAFGFPGADDLGNMFQFYRDFSRDVNGLRDVGESRRLNPELQTFEQWLRENAKKIPIE